MLALKLQLALILIKPSRHTHVGKQMISFKDYCKRVVEQVQLDEAVPVDSAHRVVHQFLGQSSAVTFMTHLKPGTDKHTTWAKINTALVKQGVKPHHIATIATKLKPAQYE